MLGLQLLWLVNYQKVTTVFLRIFNVGPTITMVNIVLQTSENLLHPKTCYYIPSYDFSFLIYKYDVEDVCLKGVCTLLGRTIGNCL